MSEAFPQQQLISGDLGPSGPKINEFPKGSFIVYTGTDESDVDDAQQNISNATVVSANEELPDFKNLFDFGGTIELVINKTDPARSTDPKLYITEIMWGLDLSSAGHHRSATHQWIEIYNQGADLAADDGLHIVFTQNKRVVREEVQLDYSDDNVDNPNPYIVLDRLSTLNRFGSRWDLKGQSGQLTDLDLGESPVNLVSMYRKRSTNADKTGYKYDADGKPDGDVFGDGTDGDQWITSVGRLNIKGPFIGTPGAVQQDFGGQVEATKTPASLPVGTVIINEIFNSETLQWIELHNTGTAEVNVKKYEMEAVYGDKKQDTVFAVPDTDTKIPGGGFLVIANRDPVDSILAGGVDLHDSNKFPSGASHLYIVIEKAGDNKWMPSELSLPVSGILSFLRQGITSGCLRNPSSWFSEARRRTIIKRL